MIRPALTVIDVEFKETTTTLVIREDGEVPVSEVVPVGTRAVEAAISEYVHREAGLQIGERTAESLKLRLGDAGRVINVKGRRPGSGAPQSAPLDAVGVHTAALNALTPVRTALAELRERCRRSDVAVAIAGESFPGLEDLLLT